MPTNHSADADKRRSRCVVPSRPHNPTRSPFARSKRCAFRRSFPSLAAADLGGADFTGARLDSANFGGAYLLYANFGNANLSHADLGNADLSYANFGGANLEGTTGCNAVVENAQFCRTHFVSVDVSWLCSANIRHNGPSTVDFTSIALSLYAPGLKQFLLDTGMPEVFAEYMISCARSLSPNERFSLMLSSFVSYGGPDEEFARRLNQSLKDQGVTTFFYPLDAKLGQRNASVMHRGIKEHDRVVLICSEASLTRPGVLNEITEVADEEARRGGETCLIPIRLDDYVLSKDFLPKNPDLRDLIKSRVVGDFRGADKDEAKFKAALPRLVEALRKPVEIPGDR